MDKLIELLRKWEQERQGRTWEIKSTWDDKTFVISLAAGSLMHGQQISEMVSWREVEDAKVPVLVQVAQGLIDKLKARGL